MFETFPFYTLGRFQRQLCTGVNSLTGTCMVKGECIDTGGIVSANCTGLTQNNQAICCVCKFSGSNFESMSNKAFQQFNLDAVQQHLSTTRTSSTQATLPRTLEVIPAVTQYLLPAQRSVNYELICLTFNWRNPMAMDSAPQTICQLREAAQMFPKFAAIIQANTSMLTLLVAILL